jgi:hypothetical protein
MITTYCLSFYDYLYILWALQTTNNYEQSRELSDTNDRNTMSNKM